jgi:hypothetical protein
MSKSSSQKLFSRLATEGFGEAISNSKIHQQT